MKGETVALPSRGTLTNRITNISLTSGHPGSRETYFVETIKTSERNAMMQSEGQSGKDSM